MGMLGRKHSEETKEKMRKSFHSPIPSMKGRKFTDEHRKKLSNAKKGKRPHNFGMGNGYSNLRGYLVRNIDGKPQTQHRIVYESILGRKLNKKEVIHHWDENKKNNDLENLALFRHNSAHIRLHHFARRHGLKIEELKFDQPWLFNQ